MRKYIQNTLDPNEEVILDETNTVPWLIPLNIVLTILTSITLIIPIFIWWAYFETKSYNYVVTTKRIITVRGIIFINTRELLLDKVESVSIAKDYLLGNNRIFFSGTGTTQLWFSFIKDVDDAKRKIDALFENHKKSTSSAQTTTTQSPADEIAKLYDLKQKGIITDAEFKKHKAHLLG